MSRRRKAAPDLPPGDEVDARNDADPRTEADGGNSPASAASKSPAVAKPAVEAKPPAASKPPAEKKPRRPRTSGLETRIGYQFGDTSLIERALTHISAVKGPRNPTNSYQRLEFLGDHVLGLVISDMLFQAFPRANEGELSRRLADLVRKETCADVARTINLGAAIRLGGSETQGGGRLRTTILGDVCEALVGAVFLDGGYAAAADMVDRLWRERMLAPARPLLDPKTLLQEWAQGRGLPTPTYREVARSGPHHSPEFRVAVELPEREPAEGVGRSKRAAEQAAAAAMLDREGVAVDGAG
jgi:ribonuclease III